MKTPRLAALAAFFAVPLAFAQAVPPPGVRTPPVYRGETLTVRPEPADLEPGSRDRWQRFAEALGAGRSAPPRWRTVRRNDGSRSECRDQVLINGCFHSGSFSLAGPTTWTGR